MAAAGGKKETRCPLFDCVCCWRRVCSPWIPRVDPGADYVCIPAGADDSPAWSLLVGSISSSDSSIFDNVLGLHELRVARSGRILGGSDLEIWHSVETNGGVGIYTATAALTPDGHSICLFSEYVPVESKSQFVATPQAQRLQLGGETPAIAALPRLPLEPSMRCRPVSAAGRVWVPSVLYKDHRSCSLAMHRLDEDAGRWEQVGDDFQLIFEREIPYSWGGSFFQGYAVLHDDTILVSLKPSYGLFVTFSCSEGTWAEVATEKPHSTLYVPILDRGVHIKEDNSVYFIRDNDIYAYELCYDQRILKLEPPTWIDQRILKLEPPTWIDSICPFPAQEGNGFLTHLTGRLMCSVWISAGLGCWCDHLHVLVTTFRLRPQYKGIDILHSTWRRLDVSRTAGPLAIHQFCFIQEYKNAMTPSTLPLRMLDDPTCSHVIGSSQMLDCCREFLSKRPPRVYEFEEPAVQINKELYLLCEAGSQSIVYVAKFENARCHDQVLTPKYSLIISDSDRCGRSPPWHLVFSRSSSNIYAFSGEQDGHHKYSLIEEAPQYVQPATKPTSDPFSIVLEVGQQIIAVTDTLQVFYHHQSKSKWVGCCHRSDDSLTLYNKRNLTIESKHRLVLKEKSDLSGYAVLGDNSFLVSDANSNSFLVYDLRCEKWSFLGTAKPNKLLHGRSVLIEGFIYTCTSSGIAAHELVWHKKDDPKVLKDPIFLNFSWQLPFRNAWDAERMCLDCVDKDNSPDAIIFCVAQGQYRSFLPRSHSVHITTVQVTTIPRRGKRVPQRMKHVAIGTCFVQHDKSLVLTKNCFAVGT